MARIPSGADTYKFIPEIWSTRVEEAIKSDLVCWDAIDSSWQTQLKKGDTLYIPKTNTVTATEITIGTKGSSLNPFNTAAVTLTVNQYYEAPVDIDYTTKFQTQAAMETYAVKEGSYAIAVAMDTYINTLFYSLGGYTTSAYGADGQTLTDDILLYMVETLDEAGVPRDGNRSLILDPSGLVDMLKIDKFISANYVALGAVTNGNVGKSPIYGCNVKVTNNLLAATTGAYGCLLHKRAIGAVAQIEKGWRKEYEDLHTTRYQSEALWGAVEVNDSFGIPFYTRKK